MVSELQELSFYTWGEQRELKVEVELEVEVEVDTGR